MVTKVVQECSIQNYQTQNMHHQQRGQHKMFSGLSIKKKKLFFRALKKLSELFLLKVLLDLFNNDS